MFDYFLGFILESVIFIEMSESLNVLVKKIVNE